MSSASACGFLCGVAVGVAVMYFVDPQGGRRRRALVRDKATSWAHTAGDFADKQSRDLRNRATGLAYEARKAVGA